MTETSTYERLPCGALGRPRYNDPGWECHGVGLIVVMTFKPLGSIERIPIVLPRRALEIVDPGPWWELPVRDFTGGDHAHLVVPRRPPSEPRPASNAVLVRHDERLAYPVRVDKSMYGVREEAGRCDR